MSDLNCAIGIAVKAHRTQKDKGGRPYILHPLRVMLQMKSEEEQIVAVLHDVLEDSDYKPEDLEAEGFSPAILEALDALTKRKGEDRISAAHRAAAVPLARRVKLADNADNRDVSRLGNLAQPDLDRLAEYHRVYEILIAAEKGLSAPGG